jgi:hypothetical protein
MTNLSDADKQYIRKTLRSADPEAVRIGPYSVHDGIYNSPTTVTVNNVFHLTINIEGNENAGERLRELLKSLQLSESNIQGLIIRELANERSPVEPEKNTGFFAKLLGRTA